LTPLTVKETQQTFSPDPSTLALVQIVASKQKQLICFRWKTVLTDLSHLSSTTEQVSRGTLPRDCQVFLFYYFPNFHGRVTGT
jgi:hypothetical protein